MQTINTYIYPAIFSYEPNQEISVTFPDLECATCGRNDADAFHMARDLLGLVLFGLEEDGENIPSPSSIHEVEVKENECVVLVDVFMPSVRMAQMNRSVSRTVTLPAWLNAAAQEKGVNFSAILQDGLKETLGY